MNRRTKSLSLCLLSSVFIGCQTQGRSLDDLASGPSIDPRFVGVSEELIEHERLQLAETLPPDLVPLHGHSGVLHINASLTPVAVESPMSIESAASSVPIEWSLDAGLGMYLRLARRPFSECPAAGTSVGDGITMLDGADGMDHSIRAYHRTSTSRTSWNLTDSAFTLGRYYFQGCLIQITAGVFTGGATNTVDVEVVDRLPDLALLNAYIFTGGPRRGELLLRIQDNGVRPDIRGESFVYQVEARGPGLNITHNDSSTFNHGSGAVVEPGGFRLPWDGHEYEVDVSINLDRAIPESDYSNNQVSVRWQVNHPSILVIDTLHVHENCDQRSPGEWSPAGRIHVEDTNEWVFGGGRPFDAEDDTLYPTAGDRNGLIVFKIDNHPVDKNLTFFLAFDDCNLLFHGCGEEWREHPFGAHPSSTGIAEAVLTPAHRTSGEAVPARSDGPDDCSFTAMFRLMEPSRARAEGYEVDCTLAIDRSGLGPSTLCYRP